MKYLKEIIMEYLPNSLQNLKLDLIRNNLGVNVENSKVLGETLENLPRNLKFLSENDLGNCSDNMKWIGQAMK